MAGMGWNRRKVVKGVGNFIALAVLGTAPTLANQTQLSADLGEIKKRIAELEGRYREVMRLLPRKPDPLEGAEAKSLKRLAEELRQELIRSYTALIASAKSQKEILSRLRPAGWEAQVQALEGEKERAKKRIRELEQEGGYWAPFSPKLFVDLPAIGWMAFILKEVNEQKLQNVLAMASGGMQAVGVNPAVELQVGGNGIPPVLRTVFLNQTALAGNPNLPPFLTPIAEERRGEEKGVRFLLRPTVKGFGTPVLVIADRIGVEGPILRSIRRSGAFYLSQKPDPEQVETLIWSSVKHAPKMVVARNEFHLGRGEHQVSDYQEEALERLVLAIVGATGGKR